MEKSKFFLSDREKHVEMFKEYENRVEMSDKCVNANLNHFWNRNKFIEFWGLRTQTFKEHTHEEKHGNGKFLLHDNLRFKRYQEGYHESGVYEGSTNVIDLGNDSVSDFFLLTPSQDLDLTWMKPKDKFDLNDSIQYRNLKNIMVNVDNLANSKLPYYSKEHCVMDLSFNLLVNGKKSKLKSEQQVAAFRSFFECHRNQITTYHVDHVTLEGFDKATYNDIVSYLQEKQIPASKRFKFDMTADLQCLKNAKMVKEELTK